MGTKLKNIKYSKFIKAVTFILAVTFLTGGLTIFLSTAINRDISWEAISKGSYFESSDLRHEIYDITKKFSILLENYKSEEHIKNKVNLKNDMNNNYSYSMSLSEIYRNFKEDYYKKNSIEQDPAAEKEMISKFEEEYSKEIELYKNQYLSNELNNYNDLIKRINNISGLYYYTLSEGYKHSNVSNKSKEFFKAQPLYILFDDNGYIASHKAFDRYYYEFNYNNYQRDTIYLALDDTFLAPRIDKWNNDKKASIHELQVIALLFIGFIICIIYLICVSGRKAEDKKVHLSLVDRIYLDINIIVTAGIVFLVGVLIREYYRDIKYEFFIPLLGVASLVSITLLLSIVRHMKNKTIITHNLCYKILAIIFSFPKKLLTVAPISVKMIPTPKKARDLKSIIEGLKHIKNGDVDYKIKASSKGIYGELAEDINSIAHGLKVAVDNEIKSERLKTELITNVSHDIRTPLTSIITYVDLLKNEGLDSENAEKYLEVLEQKSIRLKTLTDDLFEVSKASSGNIPVKLEKVDISALLTQCMGELNNKIEASELDFQFNYPKEKVFVRADGKLLWRVVENLMTNIFKYSLKNTRVYIDVEVCEKSASVIFKNISHCKLNVNVDELMERFKRGDESRNSEGSGLGLAITKSLVELQGGRFSISIDGDLFKAIVTIPRYEE